MPVRSAWRDLELPEVDLWSLYMEQPRPYPDDHTLLVDGDSARAYTFAQMRQLAEAWGRGLQQRLGWAKGDVLGLYTPNDIDTPVVTLGLHWAGGVATPANPTYTVDELARQLADARAAALVTQRALLPAAREAARRAGIPADRVLLLGAARDPSGAHRHWADLVAPPGPAGPAAARPAVDPRADLAYLVYSSGTTGLPKGVMLTHRNVVANALQSRCIEARTLDWDLDRQLGILPFFHIYGLAVVLNMTLSTGAPCIVMAKFDLDRACGLIQQHAVTFLYVPPPIVLALGKYPVVARYDLSSLRWINSGAAPLSRDLVAAVWERLKVGVKQGYGLSETSPIITVQRPDEWWRFCGSVGRLIPNMEAMIVDPDGNELPAGEAGELLVKGPNVFQGYLNRPELDRDTFTADGWYRTGDIGYVCPKGHFYITDRLKELIKYKGFQVPPAELEEKLIGRDDIADVGVVGVWHADRQSEVPRAYVVLAPGVKPSDALARDIVAWLDGSVSPPKRLRGGVRFVEAIPKSPSGKILRRILKDQAKAEQAAAEQAAAGARAKL